MSKTGKIILWIVIAVVVVGGGIWWWIASQGNFPIATPAATNTIPEATSSTEGTASVTQPASYPQGSSDQSINQDMTSLNTQMNGLNSDNASVTESMNDQPVQQAQ